MDDNESQSNTFSDENSDAIDADINQGSGSMMMDDEAT